MNIGFNPSQLTQMIPGMPGNSGADAASKTGKAPIQDGFGELLLKKFEAPEATTSSSSDLRTGVGGFIREVNDVQQAAAATRTAFLAGESGNLHQTMIAGQEASVSFSLMVEMRNKLLEAYQELMRIQI